LADAVVIGAGSMVGAGVFAVWSPAAAAAGTGLLIGLAIAGVAAFCNATSSAELAAEYPESGGTYVYGRRGLGPGWGHLAGWGFVVGKTASCAAMAMTIGAYWWPSQARPVAIAAVLGVVALNLRGLSRTVAVTRILLVTTLAALAVVVTAGWSGDAAALDRLTPIDTDARGVLRAAGYLFFAFAGYARIATLGEEVREPAIVIPKAIPRALGGVLGLYAVVGVTALASVPIADLARTDAPLQLLVATGPLHVLSAAVRVSAGIAALGVLLNLVPGVSRTVLAMARQRDLPAVLTSLDRRSNPVRAELAVGAAVIAVILLTGLRDAVALSGVAVLVYYAITNAAALTLPRSQRRWHQGFAAAGLVLCVAIALALPLRALTVGSTILGVGVAVRQITTRVAGTSPRSGRNA
jgi:APA family basic amino acid/polyamine antiporter